MNFSEVVNRVKALFCEEDDKGRTLTPDPRGFYSVSPGGDLDLTRGEKEKVVPGTLIRRDIEHESPGVKEGSISEPRETRLLRNLFDDIITTLTKIPAKDKIIGPLLDSLIVYRRAYYEWRSRKSSLETSRKIDTTSEEWAVAKATKALAETTEKCFKTIEHQLQIAPQLKFALDKLYELQDFVYGVNKTEPAKLGSILLNLETRLKNLGHATLNPKKEPLSLKKSVVGQLSGDVKVLVKALKADRFKSGKEQTLAIAQKISEQAVEVVNAFYNDSISEAQAVKELFSMR